MECGARCCQYCPPPVPRQSPYRGPFNTPTSLYTEFPVPRAVAVADSMPVRDSRNQSIVRSKTPMPRTAARAIPAAPHRPSRRQFNAKMPSGRIVDIPTYDGLKLKGTVYSAGENRPCVVMASGVCSPILSIPTSASLSYGIIAVYRPWRQEGRAASTSIQC